MRKKIINYKEASKILGNFNEIVEVYKGVAENTIRTLKGEDFIFSFYNAGYDIDIFYIEKIKEGVIKLTKNQDKIRYIVRINFVYLSEEVFLEGVTK